MAPVPATRTPLVPGRVSPRRPVPASIPRPEYVDRPAPKPWTGPDVFDESAPEPVPAPHDNQVFAGLKAVCGRKGFVWNA